MQTLTRTVAAAHNALRGRRRFGDFIDLRSIPLAPDFTKLGLATADVMSHEAIREASNRGFAPITVVVCDPAGRVIVKKRQDSCPNGPAAYAEVYRWEKYVLYLSHHT